MQRESIYIYILWYIYIYIHTYLHLYIVCAYSMVLLGMHIYFHMSIDTSYCHSRGISGPVWDLRCRPQPSRQQWRPAARRRRWTNRQASNFRV